MAKKNYDYIIIGAGVNGLLSAHQLHMGGYSVLLVEASEELGASLKTQTTEFGHIGGNLFSSENTDMAQSLLSFLDSCIDFPVNFTEQEESIVTFESGKFQDFVGFGNKAPKFFDEISYYLNSKRLKLSHSWFHILEAITSNLPFDIVTKSQVTSFIVEEEQVTGVVINGDKTLRADNFVYTANPQDLAKLLPEDVLGTRNKQKLAKSKLWSAIVLDFVHNDIASDKLETHLLMAGTEDAVPLVGGFQDPFSMPAGEVVQKSQWLSFIPGELSEDPESSGQLVREMRKQLKRAYPEFFTNLAFEKISLYSNSHGQIELRLNQQMKLNNLQNLWLTSNELSPFKNILGCLAQTSLFLAHLDLKPCPIPAIQTELGEA